MKNDILFHTNLNPRYVCAKVYVCDKIIKTNINHKLKIFFICINKSDMKADILEKDFKYTWSPQTVHNTPVMNILKGYFYLILF